MTLQTVVAVPYSQLVTVPTLWVFDLVIESALVFNHVLTMMLLLNVFYVQDTTFEVRLTCLSDLMRSAKFYIYFILPLSGTVSRCIVYCIVMLMFKTFDWPSRSSYI